MSRRSIKQPIPLRRSSSLCTERGSILSSFSRSNSINSTAATVGAPSLGFPTRTESPVEDPAGFDHAWPQASWGAPMSPYVIPTRPDSCPPDTNAYGANIRTMDMMPYPSMASPISSSSDSDSDSDSDHTPGINEPALDSSRRNAVVIDPDQLGVAFQQLHTSRETGGQRPGNSSISHHSNLKGVHGNRHQKQGHESRSKSVRFVGEGRPVNPEPLWPGGPMGSIPQAWPSYIPAGAPREYLSEPEAPIYPIGAASNHWGAPHPAMDNIGHPVLPYGQHQYIPAAPHRGMTNNVPANPARVNESGTSKPLLSVNTRPKKQVRISPIVDVAPSSFTRNQETKPPSSPSGYSSVSESIAGPQTPPNDMRIVHIPVVSEDTTHPAHRISYGEFPKISRQMSITDIISRLVKHGCHNLTSQLDLGTFGHIPVANGGFSDVYRGRLRNGQQVAIKSLRVDAQSLSQNPKHLKHAARELHTWGKCNHPNVLQLLGLAIFRDRIGMVSPWMSEGSLTQYLRRVPGANKCNICAQIAGGLAYMHKIGIAHGDVKGANVLVSSDGVPALTDFGNSHLQERTLGFTQSTNGASMTLRWSAPEVIKESCTNDKAADIYALGMTILEVLTGDPPYYYVKSESSVMLRVVMHKEHPQRPEVIPTNSRDGNRLWDLLIACWAFKPEARPTAEVVFNTMRSITPQGLWVNW